MSPHTPKNPTSDSPQTSATSTTPAGPRAARRLRRPSRRLTVLAGGLVLAGALTGTGFTVQSAVAEQQQQAQQQREDRAAAKAAAISETHLAASVALYDADTALDAAANKVDASALSATTSSLAGYISMPLDEVTELTAQAEVQAEQVQAAAVEADRVAAEAAQAAAEAQAAAQAQAAAEAQAAADAIAAGNTVDGAKATAARLAAERYGWGDSQFSCLAQLWQKESEWKYTAYNDNGGATGIPQALPGSKMASAGSDWATNASTQIAWGLEYINASYGSPCSAWSHSQAMNWY